MELSLAWMEEAAGVEVVVVVEGHLMAVCGFGEQTDMVEGEGEEEADWLFWLGMLSEVERVVALIEVVWLQVEEEGHVMRMKTKFHPSDWQG